VSRDQASRESEVPKDRFLVVRLEREDLQRVKKAAEEEHLAPATWARQVLLKALDRQEKKKG
jgi:predicted DNA binding CopG/RHH family protein